jgi:hypothetical protein
MTPPVPGKNAARRTRYYSRHGFSPQTGTVAVPQTVVYNPSHRGIREPIAHWLRPDGKTFCGHHPERTVGWEPYYDASPYRMCGTCMRSARGATQKSAADQRRDDAESAAPPEQD